MEIDIVQESNDELVVFECKWTNAKLDQTILSRLIEKGKYLDAKKFGLFAKSGFTDSVNDGNALLYLPADLYNTQ